jgi:hypothetical protein
LEKSCVKSKLTFWKKVVQKVNKVGFFYRKSLWNVEWIDVFIKKIDKKILENF